MTGIRYWTPIFLALLTVIGCAPSYTAPEPRPIQIPAAPAAETAVVPVTEFPKDPTLQQCLGYAQMNNPGVAAAFARWKAASERVPQATALPDPTVGYKYRFNPRADNERQMFEAEQMFPWFGKLDLQEQAAVAAAQVERSRYQAVRIKLSSDLKAAWYEYYFVGKSVASVEENIKLMKAFEEIALARYQTSKATQQDVIRAQIELATLENQLRSLKDLRQPAAAKVNAAMSRPVDAPLAWPKELARDDIKFDEAELDGKLRNNWDLIAAQSEVTRSRSDIELARKGYSPDITVGVEYADMTSSGGADGKDAYTGKVSVNLPIWRQRLSASVDEAAQRHRGAVADKMELANTLAADLKMAAYNYRDAKRKIELYRDVLIPKQTESINAMQRSYQAGGGTFLELIDAERTLLEFRLAYHRAIADQATSLARIEMLIGKEL
jgi:cobalt-zinc-cadmium efflux system outer membrane protein